ncbi:MAG: chloride channel protein [Bacteriovoracaceae bacterium]|nr:chloride channel protein [Bacteriovoracaceae bacterium]
MKAREFWKLHILGPFLKDDAAKENTYLALSILTGFCAAVVAVFIKYATHALTEFFGTGQSFSLNSILWGGAAILISGFLTTRFFENSAGSGIPKTRVALAVFNGKIPFKDTLAKLVCSILSLSSGFSLGREGPTVAIASGIGSAFGEFFHLSKKKVKNLVAMGAAGGLAAAFNTPIAAVTFTLEEVIGDLNAKVLGSIIVSTIVASVTALLLQGDQPTFAELHYKLGDVRELFVYFVVGLSAAVVGPLWVRSVLKMREINQKIFRGHKLTVIMVTFGIVALVSLFNTDVLGSGHETIEKTLHAYFSDWRILLTLLVLKFALTTLCYSSGVSGGLFMPTLMTGALLGGLVGSIFQLFFPELIVSVGSYALVGMGAYFAAVIRTPITSIIMVFEMTRDYKIMLPLMIANITAYAIAKRLHKGSVYENISQQDGIYLPSHEDNEMMDTLLVEDAMVSEVVTLNSKLPVIEALRQIKKSDISGYPVLNNGLMVGMVSKSDIARACARREGYRMIESVAERSIVKIYSDQSLMVAFHRLRKFNISRLPVVSRLNNRRIIGLITAEDIVNKFGYHVKEEMEEGQELFDFDQIEEQFDFDQIEELEQNAVEGETEVSSKAPADNLDDAAIRIEKEFKKEKE